MKSIDEIYRDFPDEVRERAAPPGGAAGWADPVSRILRLLAVILLISVVAALIVPTGMTALSSARQSTAEHLFSQLDQAIESYRLDFGAYPPGDGTGTGALVEALSRSVPKKQKYFEFPPDLLNRGNIVNPVRAESGVIHYLYPGHHQPSKFDLWAEDCNGNPAGVNNW